MKGLAAIGAAAFIVTEVRPLQASPDLPTFKPVR
jgi:hypothetical protein